MMGLFLSVVYNESPFNCCRYGEVVPPQAINQLIKMNRLGSGSDLDQPAPADGCAESQSLLARSEAGK